MVDAATFRGKSANVAHPDLIEAAKLRDADIERLARKLYKIKAGAYRQGLLEAQARHGGKRAHVVLSQAIRNAIADEAELHAKISVQTFNRQIEAFGKRNQELPREDFIRELRSFMRRRGASRSKVVSEIAPLTARLDAEVAFYRENGVEPEFDFTGPRAICPLCQWLKAHSPYPVATVLEVGYPHLQCTHRWRSRSRANVALREGGLRQGVISAGRGEPAGILGSQAIVQRLGSIPLAIDALERDAA